jgi:GNAT superfamily N-acetyltransferase
VRAHPEDAPALTNIAFAAKRHWGYPKAWIEGWREALTITPEFISSHETHIAVVQSQRTGFHALAPNERGLELLHLWVLPESMGHGIGRALFAHALERAGRLGLRTLEIESDPNAEGFYLRMGARRIGIKTEFLEGQPRVLPVLRYKIAP